MCTRYTAYFLNPYSTFPFVVFFPIGPAIRSSPTCLEQNRNTQSSSCGIRWTWESPDHEIKKKRKIHGQFYVTMERYTWKEDAGILIIVQYAAKPTQLKGTHRKKQRERGKSLVEENEKTQTMVIGLAVSRLRRHHGHQGQAPRWRRGMSGGGGDGCGWGKGYCYVRQKEDIAWSKEGENVLLQHGRRQRQKARWASQHTAHISRKYETRANHNAGN